MSAEVLLAIAVGIGLSAACGFRVFVPLLLLNLASRVGYVQLAQALSGWAVTQRASYSPRRRCLKSWPTVSPDWTISWT